MSRLWSLREHVIRYRFAEFIVSPRRRVLLRQGREQPLIPRYFDLLVFLIERRADAVHRREIFDRVWSDVIVSDSALSQAIRSIRRVLGDDSREPRFVKTVSRHGYQFVCAALLEEADDGVWPPVTSAEPTVSPGAPEASPSLQEFGTPTATDSSYVDRGNDGIAARSDATAVSIVEPPSDPSRAGARHPAPGSAPVTGGTADSRDEREWVRLIELIKTPPASSGREEDQRDAAERLHSLGTVETLIRLGMGVDATYARALLRDTRWDVPGAGEVTIAGQPHAAAIAQHLIRIRLRRLLGIATTRWATAAAGAGVAGLLGGIIGGLLLVVASAGGTSPAVVPVLAVIGAVCGALAGAGVGAGIAVAEAVMRSHRTLALGLGGAIGGSIVGVSIQMLGRWTLEVLVGVAPPIGGSVEGAAIGLAAGLGFAAATRGAIGGPAAPRGRSRLLAVAITATACAGAALVLSLAGLPLVGGSIHLVAQAAHAGAQPLLAPLGRLIGEPDFGPVSAALIATGEGAAFGLGLSFGITRRH